MNKSQMNLNKNDGRQVIKPKENGLYEVRTLLPNGNVLKGVCEKEELEKHFLLHAKQYNNVKRELSDEKATYYFLNENNEDYKSGVYNTQITLSEDDTGLNKEGSLDQSLMQAKIESRLNIKRIRSRNLKIYGLSFALLFTGLMGSISYSLNRKMNQDMEKLTNSNKIYQYAINDLSVDDLTDFEKKAVEIVDERIKEEQMEKLYQEMLEDSVKEDTKSTK